MPVLAVLGDTNLVGDGNFALAKTGNGVRAEKVLPNGLRLVKEFHLGSNYLIEADVTLANTSGQPLAVPAQEVVVGTATPMDVDDNNFSMYGGAMWFDGLQLAGWRVDYFTPHMISGFFAARRRRNFAAARAMSSGWRRTTSFSRCWR